jgi:predicted CoA-binding protein
LSSSPDDDALRRLLDGARRIAVVGLSPKPYRDANHVARYLLERGYEVIPVYPRGDEILGRRVYRRVQDVPGRVDIVDVFRRVEAVPDVVDDAIAAQARAVWLQSGLVHEEAARRAHEAGLVVVMDRCLRVEHAHLLGRDWQRN